MWNKVLNPLNLDVGLENYVYIFYKIKTTGVRNVYWKQSCTHLSENVATFYCRNVVWTYSFFQLVCELFCFHKRNKSMVTIYDINYLWRNVQNKPNEICYKVVFNQKSVLILVLSNTMINISANTVLKKLKLTFSRLSFDKLTPKTGMRHLEGSIIRYDSKAKKIKSKKIQKYYQVVLDQVRCNFYHTNLCQQRWDLLSPPKPKPDMYCEIA